MLTRTPIMLATILAIGSVSPALAQQWTYDSSPDHVYYYGPIAPQPAAPAARHGQTSQQVLRGPASAPAQTPIDPTSEHVYYYGPVTSQH